MATETTLHPDPPAWTPSALRGRDAPLHRERLGTREQLGIDPDELVVATGHQAMIWHPGVLAKDLAAAERVTLLRRDGQPARALHFIADHDANDGGLVAYPTATLERRGWRMLPTTDGGSTCDLPPAMPTAAPSSDVASTEVRRGLDAIERAVDRHRDAPNLAFQIGRATADLARPLTGPIDRHSMSRLLETPIGVHLVEAMMSDPEACIVAHDQALDADRRHRAGRDGRLPRPVARPLRRGRSDELPLWRFERDGRRPVRRGEDVDPATCRPRALLATAMARLGACDLFVHGLGGGLYDHAMERWIGAWLGADVADTLAPATVASATLRLPLASRAPDAEGERRTPEGLHRLRSDPDLGRSGPDRRAILLAAIEAAPRGSRARRAAYLELRREVDDARRRGRDQIDRYRGDLDRLAEHRRRAEVAQDRTWAFPFFTMEALTGLRRSVEVAFAPA